MHAEALLVRIHVLDQLVHVVVGHGCAQEREVAAPRDQQVVAVVVVRRSLLYHIHERLRLLLRVHLERGQLRVVLEPVVVLLPVHAVAAAVAEEVALRGRAVVVVHHVDEHVALRALARAPTPHELQLLVLRALRLVRVMHAVDAPRIETHRGVHRLHLLGVAEGIDAPAHSGAHAELVVDEPDAKRHFVDDVLVARRRLVRHHPTTEVKLELRVMQSTISNLTIFHQLVHESLHRLVLFTPPALEETLLDVPI